MRIRYANGSISPQEVVHFLGLTGRLTDFAGRIAVHKEVVKAAEECGLEVPDHRLQEFADQYRAARGLHALDDMLAFMDGLALTVDDFEAFCRATLLADALRAKWGHDDAVREYFLTHHAELDTARVSVIVVDSQELAREILMRATEDGEDFHQMARAYSVERASGDRGGYVGHLGRQMLSPEVAAKLFSASAGEVLGPFEEGERYRLILVEEVIKAELTDDVKEEIKDALLARWEQELLKEGFAVELPSEDANESIHADEINP